MYIDQDQWLGVVRREYLQDFIRQGGAAVKVAVPLAAEETGRLCGELRAMAREEGYQFALVDAATTRLQLIDKLFHDVAGQVDWQGLARAALASLLAARRYRMPPPGTAPDVRALALANERDEDILRQELLRHLESAVYRDIAMCHEFRTAMFHLCLAELDPAPAHTELAQALVQWLRGELKRIVALKPALIFQRVARHNARHMLSSLCHWLHATGQGGLLLALDISRLGVARRPREGAQGQYYSTAAVMDAYELVRQFIDATDEMVHCLIAIFAAPAFLSDEKRGLGSYDALRMRIADEVRDRHRVNPLGSLVRLGACDPAQPQPHLQEATAHD